MQELKPVAIIKHIHGGSPLYQFGNAANNLPENTLLYPLPATHRIVPVELLKSAAIEIVNPYIKRELQAIIDKEPT
jgi:hypothetical protein